MKDKMIASLPAEYPFRDTLYWFNTIDSTNNYLKQLALNGAPEGTAVIAEQQTGGRGRMGRSFFSPAGKGLYLSFLLRPDCSAGALMHLTCAGAVAVCDAIKEVTGTRPGIKWTNDLILNGKKLGGILTELSTDSNGNVKYAIMGIGINCLHTQEDFPPELKEMATSLKIANLQGNPAILACAILQRLAKLCQTLLTDKAVLMDAYRSDCITLGMDIQWTKDDAIYAGKALDIDADGGLVVLSNSGKTETISTGEVSVRGMYGYL